MQKYDVVALGELLIDFTNSGISSQGNDLYEANPGGAPGNVLAMLSRSGRRTALISRVGNDQFGQLLRNTLTEIGVDNSFVQVDDVYPTTLAFVHNQVDGERSFSFYRKPGADVLLAPGGLPENILKDCTIFHFGSVSLTQEPARAATKRAVELAKTGRALITFDPNLRPPLWSDLKEAKEQVAWGFSCCDILKIADNELEWFSGSSDYAAGIASLFDTYPMKLIFLTLGKEGSAVYSRKFSVSVPTFTDILPIDKTGAGDTFFGSVLNSLLDTDLDALTPSLCRNVLAYANAAATLITTRKGALRMMPGPEEIQELLAH